MKQLIRSKRIFVENNRWVDGAVEVTGGRVTAIFDQSQMLNATITHDTGACWLLPGLVDCHVHINEPGRTEWEGFATATQAAAAGGITTLVDMPLNCIPVTTSLTALEEKIEALGEQLTVDCAFHGGIIPGNVDEIAPMVEAGVRTFKCFMIDSGIPEFPPVNFEQLKVAMTELSRCGATLLAHAEVDCVGADASSELERSPASYRAYLQSRPRAMENQAIEQLIELARLTRCRVHVVHLSSSDAIARIRQAKAEGVAITCETCPHYLLLSAEKIADGDGRFKCAPPIREESNRLLLWQGLKDGTIDMVVSDHSPCTPALKLLSKQNLKDAWGGISSLQFGLPLIWREAQVQGIAMDQVLTWMACQPAKLAGLSQRKGRIAVGMDADFAEFDPSQSLIIDRSMILHRHKETPYESWRGQGRVHATWLRGVRIFCDGKFLVPPTGERLP